MSSHYVSLLVCLCVVCCHTVSEASKPPAGARILKGRSMFVICSPSKLGFLTCFKRRTHILAMVPASRGALVENMFDKVWEVDFSIFFNYKVFELQVAGFRAIYHLVLVGRDEPLEWVPHHGEGNGRLCKKALKFSSFKKYSLFTFYLRSATFSGTWNISGTILWSLMLDFFV